MLSDWGILRPWLTWRTLEASYWLMHWFRSLQKVARIHSALSMVDPKALEVQEPFDQMKSSMVDLSAIKDPWTEIGLEVPKDCEPLRKLNEAGDEAETRIAWMEHIAGVGVCPVCLALSVWLKGRLVHNYNAQRTKALVMAKTGLIQRNQQTLKRYHQNISIRGEVWRLWAEGQPTQIQGRDCSWFS